MVQQRVNLSEGANPFLHHTARAGWWRKGLAPPKEREERRGKREERDKHDEDERVEGRKSSVPEWRDGAEKGQSLG